MFTSVQVELEIYSGLENPSWSLSRAQVEVFNVAWCKIVSTTAQTPFAPFDEGLGYRGLKLTAVSGSDSLEARLARGRIINSETTTSEIREWRDPSRNLERWLIETGRTNLTTELNAYLMSECRSEES